MMKLLTLSLLSLIALCSAGDQKRICYYTNWSQYRPEPYTFLPENIDPFLCTHINYAFAGLDGNTLALTEYNDEEMIGRVMALKDVNPDLFVLLSVGGWNMGVAAMSAMLATPENRQEFVTTSVPFLQSRGFDGLDLDFEFPGMNRDDLDPPQSSPPEDKERFTALVQELSFAFNGADLLLTAAVSCNQDIIDGAYDIGAITQNLDWLGLMSYDMNMPYGSETSCHSPLYVPDEPYVPDGYTEKSVDFCLNSYLQRGAPSSKLMMGIPTYGRSFELADPNDYDLYSPAEGTHEGPPIYEICEQYIDGGSEVFDVPHGVLYAFNSAGQWVSYDNPESIDFKMTYLIDNNYAGVIAYSLDMDDFVGASSCFGGQQYPLISKIKERLSEP